MDVYSYNKEKGQFAEQRSLEELEEKLGSGEVNFWVDVYGDNFEVEINQIGEIMEFHPLSLDDVLTPENRSSMEIFDNYLYALFRTPELDSELGEMQSNQLSLFIGEEFLVTCHRKPVNSVQTVKQKLEETPQQLWGKGPDHLAYQILDRSTDNYLALLDQFEEQIDVIEEEIFTEPDEDLLTQISDLRADLVYLQRTISPQRNVASKLTRPEASFIREDRQVYFRDLKDNLDQIYDLITHFRELLGGTRDMYMTNISNRMNEVMQTLTIVATIFIPLTFVAGIYGMNFEVMPELGWEWGYFGALGIMGLIALGMAHYFSRKDWL